jgi:hypothetical protein
MNTKYIIRWLHLSFVIWIAHGQLYTEMNDLVDQLFNESRYNKFLRPLYNQSQPIEVNFEVEHNKTNICLQMRTFF